MEHWWALNSTSSCSFEKSIGRFMLFNYSLLCFTFIIGTSANLLVCWVVFRAKSLRTGSNALLVNLAAGDLIRCLVDSPVFLVVLVLRERNARSGSALCRVQQLTYLLCSCAQLLTLAAISVERFQTIAFPFNPEKRKGRIWIWILIIWIFSVTLAVSSLMLSTEPLSFPMCRHLHPAQMRELYTVSFDAYFLIPIWALCVILIAVNYLRIFVVVKQHSNKIFDSGVQPTLCVVTRVSGCQLPHSSALKTERSEGNYPPPASGIVGAVCVLTPKAKALGKARVEGKLAKRLGYIIANVVLFWMPLVLLLTLRLVVKCKLGNVGTGNLGDGTDVCPCCCGPAHIHAAPSPLLHRVPQTLLHQSELLIADRPIRKQLRDQAISA
ncbi:Neuropeptide FF receptor 2 [Bagarius yarrelli]|uniref:Neuropeptide FF receptor 2 n=1 Tax=Bagarius yarrelli TaxID=175774 RepID=A0A556U7S6_BAGYA|nr:Neuropeptide FF receptor 2 [Bagarius yarrelli]